MKARDVSSSLNVANSSVWDASFSDVLARMLSILAAASDVLARMLSILAAASDVSS